MIKTYAEKLRDPRWQKKRLEILQEQGWKCADCDSIEKTLHIHHGRYDKDKEPWEYEPAAYHVLCVDCHSARQELQEHVKFNLSLLSTADLNLIMMLACGLYGTRFQAEMDLVAVRKAIAAAIWENSWCTDFTREGEFIDHQA